MSKINIFGLGGLNEIGKNMYVIEVDEDIFVFDAGLKYADDNMLGVDYIIPNYDYLKEHKDRIKGLFITHGHDEQMGAIPDLLLDLPELNIYGTKFTLEIIEQELKEENLKVGHLIEIKPHRKIIFGKNSIFPISLTHAVPESVGYVLYTDQGAIFYTGNFVFDSTMLGSYKTDIGKLAYVGKQGVLCLLSESIYADRKGYTSPNHRTSSIMQEILNTHDNRILYNVFQTQIYRIQELFHEVMRTNRNVVIVGKQLESIILRAINEQYVTFDKNRILNIHHINDENILVIISDDREKPFSNLGRVVKGYDKFIKLSEKDTVVIASPVYDGMEKTATDIFDKTARLGAELIILSNKKYLSHHASREDLMLMIDLMQPKYYFPVIGEYRHQVGNAEAAKQVGIAEDHILLRLNGDVVTFVDGVLQEGNLKVPIDDILIDGKTVGDIGELVLKDREILSENGLVIVTVTIDKTSKKVLAGPEILTRGFIYVKDNIDLMKEAEKLSLKIVQENIKPHYVDFNKIKSGIRDEVGKYFYKATECKPMILIVMQEI